MKFFPADISRVIRSITHSRHVRVRTYLTTLVMVPMLGFCALAFTVVSPRLAAQRTADEALRHIEQTQVLVSMSVLVGQEQTPLQMLVSKKTFNIDDALLKMFIGFDPVERIALTRKHTESFVQAHPDDQVIQSINKSLIQLRNDMADGKTTETQVFDRFRTMQHVLLAAWQRETVATLELSLDGSLKLHEDIARIDALVELSMHSTSEFEGMFSILYTPVEKQLKLQLELNQIHALTQAALSRAIESSGPSRRPMTVKLRDGVNARLINAQFKPFLDGQSFEPMGAQVKIASVVKGGVGFGTDLNELLQLSIDDAVRSTQEIQVKTSRELKTTVALVMLVGLLTTMLAMLVSRWFTRPLRALADRAQRVAGGDLDVEAATESGPLEIHTVGRVVDDLVASLRKVQLQTAALASGALSDSVLAEIAPGPLGESVQGSVNRLLRSIREREELQEALSHQATHDALTGLPNRPAAMIALDQALARAARHDQSLAVLFIDLDEFKRANDEGGHAVGDHVLQLVGERIRNVARHGDVVARLGGDEFLVIAEMIGTPDKARVLAARIIEVLSEPMDIDGSLVRIGASVGFAMPDDRVTDAGDLLRKSDLAMYAAKQSGRGRVVEFDVNLNKAYEEKRLVEKAMIDALRDANGLSMHYQPIVDVRTGQLLSVEALLRWDSELWGSMSPASFIPLLEQSPVICDIGRWVLVEATTQIQRARQIPDFEDLTVAVNISGRHLENVSLVADVEHALAVSGLPAHALTIELTETALVDLGKATKQTRAIRALGVKIAIDDFGTGYTSVAQLTRMPVDVLKIDRAFIDQISSVASRRIVELVIEIGQTLGMQVIGEGVEEQSQLDALGELGCDSAQGYLLSRPMPIENLLDLLHDLPEIDIAV
jgi:diguanylate cyclase (GGDEF)-like protein